MTVVSEIDASKAFKEGAALEVIREPKYGNFTIRWKQGGNLPEELTGMYTKQAFAEAAASTYLSSRDAHFEIVERKKAVVEGKKAHAKRQEKLEDK